METEDFWQVAFLLAYYKYADTKVASEEADKATAEWAERFEPEEG